MHFDNSFFEDEVREGFYVPGMIKRAWAAELEVLSEVDRICQKYNIEYFADWGSLLATVRHSGFIPWDDDLDIVMKRQDYERFLSVCKDEFPEGYEAYNYKNNDDYWLYICRVVGKKRICFEEDHLNRFHQFPYIVGVDIFVLDYVSRDEKAENSRDALARYTIVTADKIAEGKLDGNDAIEAIKVIDGGAGTKFEGEYKKLLCISAGSEDAKRAMDEFRRSLYSLAEELFGKFFDVEADDLTQLFPFGMQNKNFRFPKSMYEKSVRLPYEGITMPVPYRYNEVLKKRYGDYMRLVKNAGAHGYPFFETQHNEFVKLLDFELPHFVPDMKMLVREKANADSADSYKIKLKEMTSLLVEVVNRDELDCGNIQELAIYIGTLLEQYEQNQELLVGKLENLCEIVYSIYLILSGEAEVASIDEDVKKIRRIANEVECEISSKLLARKKVVFLLYKPEAFYLYERILKRYGDDTDIFFVPVPYSYKNYDGSTHDRKLVTDGYPDRIKLENADEFDVEFLRPDVIYTQQPFDEWNPVTVVDKKFYSTSLKTCCNQLIYMPWFVVSEFSDTDYRQYHNMKDYVLMPGVVYADKVLIQSENMRELYIKKITEWMPDVSRVIWENKISVYNTSCAYEDNEPGDKVRPDRKKLLYHLEVSSFASYENCIERIERNLKLFEDAKDKLDIIWLQDETFEENLKKISQDIFEKYKELRNNSYANISCDMSHLDINSHAEQDFIARCHAYYGDSCRMAMLFSISQKPVMIASYQC